MDKELFEYGFCVWLLVMEWKVVFTVTGILLSLQRVPRSFAPGSLGPDGGKGRPRGQESCGQAVSCSFTHGY